MLFKRLVSQNSKQLIELSPHIIKASPYQPRRQFDYYELMELSQSIRENGLIQPITVRKTDSGYELISGERRLRASIIANLRVVPCVLIEATDRESSAIALIENIQRSDLTCFEEAQGLARLIEEFGLSQSEVAASMGMAQSTLSNKLRLLRLSAEEQRRITDAGLSERHARVLIRLEGQSRTDALDTIIARELTVSESEELVEEMLNPKTDQKKVHRHPVVADMRILTNSVVRIVESLKKSGFEATSSKNETDEFIEYKITVPKGNAKMTTPY